VGAIAMAEAIEQLEKIGIENVEMYETALTKKVFEALKKNPKVEIYVSEKHLSTVLPFNIKGMESREVAQELNDKFGIGTRAGSFCVYNVVRHLLKIEDESDIITGVNAGDENAVPGFVRASFSLCNTDEDVERFVQAIKEITK
jgi:cysteine desulfurase